MTLNKNKIIIYLVFMFYIVFFISCNKSKVDEKLDLPIKKTIVKTYSNSYSNKKKEEQYQASIGKWKLEKIIFVTFKPHERILIEKGENYTFKEKEILNSKGEIVGYRKNRLEGYFTIKGLHKNNDFNLDTLATEFFTYRMDKDRITMDSYVKYINTKTKKSVLAFDISLYFIAVK